MQIFFFIFFFSAVKQIFSTLLSVCLSASELGEDTVTEMQSDSKPMGCPWRIVVGVCVQRFPTLSRAKTDLEQQFEEMQMVIRTERSRLSDFELEEAEYFRKKKKRERMAMEEDLDESQVCM